MCRVLGVSKSGFYAWLSRAAQPPSARQMADEQLTTTIREIFERSRRSYGAPRIHAALGQQGIHCSRKRVARLMRLAALSPQRKRHRVITTDSDHAQPVAPNKLAREFKATRPDEKWLGDITYVATAEGWLYVAGVLDVYTRGVVGWAMGATMGQELVLAALEMALKRRQPERGLLHHTDRGSQYAASAYQQRLAQQGIVMSMSRRGECLDNAMMESFWATLKGECVQQEYATRAAARLSIFEYIEVWYNRSRLHSALGYRSPAAFEQLYFQALTVSTIAG
jgi:putative transposase